MVLDDRANEPVKRIVGDQEVLEFIETHHGEPTVSVMQPERNVEQLQECSASLVRRRPHGRTERKLDARKPCRHAEAGRPACNDATRVWRQLTKRLPEARRDVRDRGDLRKVDPNRPMPNGTHRRNVRVDQTGLPEPSRRGQAHSDPV